MALIGRLLLRLIVVSLGVLVAIYVGSAVACAANWNRSLTLFDIPSDSHIAIRIVIGVVMAFVLSYATMIMLMPATIGIAVAETFSVRSWIFHVLNGGISSWVGWATLVRGGEF